MIAFAKKTLIGACLALSLAGAPALAQQAPSAIAGVDGAATAQTVRNDLQAFLTRPAQQLQTELSAALLADPSLAALLLGATITDPTTQRIIGASLARASVLLVQAGNTDGAIQVLSAISSAPQGQVQTTFSTFEPQSYGTVTSTEAQAETFPKRPTTPTPLSPFL